MSNLVWTERSFKFLPFVFIFVFFAGTLARFGDPREGLMISMVATISLIYGFLLHFVQIGLTQRKSWAWKAAQILSVIHMFSVILIPFGILILRELNNVDYRTEYDSEQQAHDPFGLYPRYDERPRTSQWWDLGFILAVGCLSYSILQFDPTKYL